MELRRAIYELCWLLGPSVHEIRSCRQDEFSLQSYFLVGVFHLKDYQGDRFSTSASAHEEAAPLKQKDFLSLSASKKERQEFRSRCSKLWMISANSRDACSLPCPQRLNVCANSHATLW